MRRDDTMVGAAMATGHTGNVGSSEGPKINSMAARLNTSPCPKRPAEVSRQAVRAAKVEKDLALAVTASTTVTPAKPTRGERTLPSRPSRISEEELRALRADGHRPTSTQLNGRFLHITLNILHETKSFLLAERECEKRNIMVEASTDLTLISDIEAFHAQYGRISDMDDSEVRALRKYTMQHNQGCGTLCKRQQTRLRQLYDALCDECTTLEDSFEDSKEAMCGYIERTMKPSARPLRSECLRVSKLAQATLAQSVRDYESLNLLSYRLARIVDDNDAISDEGWDTAEREDVDFIRSLLHDVDKKIAELFRFIEDDLVSDDTAPTDNDDEVLADDEIARTDTAPTVEDQEVLTNDEVENGWTVHGADLKHEAASLSLLDEVEGDDKADEIRLQQNTLESLIKPRDDDIARLQEEVKRLCGDLDKANATIGDFTRRQNTAEEDSSTGDAVNCTVEGIVQAVTDEDVEECKPVSDELNGPSWASVCEAEDQEDAEDAEDEENAEDTEAGRVDALTHPLGAWAFPPQLKRDKDTGPAPPATSSQNTQAKQVATPRQTSSRRGDTETEVHILRRPEAATPAERAATDTPRHPSMGSCAPSRSVDTKTKTRRKGRKGASTATPPRTTTTAVPATRGDHIFRQQFDRDRTFFHDAIGELRLQVAELRRQQPGHSVEASSASPDDTSPIHHQGGDQSTVDSRGSLTSRERDLLKRLLTRSRSAAFPPASRGGGGRTPPRLRLDHWLVFPSASVEPAKDGRRCSSSSSEVAEPDRSRPPPSPSKLFMPEFICEKLDMTGSAVFRRYRENGIVRPSARPGSVELCAGLVRSLAGRDARGSAVFRRCRENGMD